MCIPIRLHSVLVFAAVIACLSWSARSQSFDLKESAVTPVQRAAGGSFSLVGAITAEEGAAQAGGTFTLESATIGMLTIIAEPDSPRLTITLVNGKALVAWPASTVGFELQEAGGFPSGSAPQWTKVDQQPSVSGAAQSVEVTILPGNHFLRLSKSAGAAPQSAATHRASEYMSR